MKEKILGMKEAANLLGVSVRTLQRRHQAGELRCVLTPGGRRRVPESEILKLQQIMGLIAPPGEALGRVPARPEKAAEITKTKPAFITPPRPPKELLVQEAIDHLSPATLIERVNYRDLLAAAARFGSFTHEQLSREAKCSTQLASAFCEKLTSSALAIKEGENYRLIVKVI